MQILIKKLVPELVGRVEPLLQCKKLWRARIRTEELLLGGMKLIRKVVGPSDLQRRINELACPDADLIPGRIACTLLVVDNKRKNLSAGPRQKRAGIPLCMTN